MTITKKAEAVANLIRTGAATPAILEAACKASDGIKNLRKMQLTYLDTILAAVG